MNAWLVFVLALTCAAVIRTEAWSSYADPFDEATDAYGCVKALLLVKPYLGGLTCELANLFLKCRLRVYGHPTLEEAEAIAEQVEEILYGYDCQLNVQGILNELRYKLLATATASSASTTSEPASTSAPTTTADSVTTTEQSETTRRTGLRGCIDISGGRRDGCVGRYNGDYMVCDGCENGIFVTCSNGIVYVRHCAPTHGQPLRFDPDSDSCEYSTPYCP